MSDGQRCQAATAIGNVGVWSEGLVVPHGVCSTVVMGVFAGAVKGKVPSGRILRQVIKPRAERKGSWPPGFVINWCFVISKYRAMYTYNNLLSACSVIKEDMGSAVTTWVALGYSFAFMAPSERKGVDEV